MSNIIEMSYSTIDVILLNHFLKFFMREKDFKYKWQKVAIIIAFGIIVHETTNMPYFTTVSNILALLEMILFSLICFKDRIYIKVIDPIIYNVLLGGTTSFILTSISAISMKEIKELMAFHTTSRIAIVILVKICVLIVVLFAGHFAKCFSMEALGKYKYIVAGVFGASFTTIGAIFEIALSKDSLIVCRYIVPITILFVVYNLVILILIEKVSIVLKDQATNSIVMNSYANLEKHILETEKNYQEIKKTKHDMLNHYSIMEYLLTQKKYKECESYLGELKSNMEKAPTYYKTGNNIIDAVINQKTEFGKQNHINFQIEANVPSYLHIDSIDLGAILSNLLDNAIEAAREVEDTSNRKIRLKMQIVNKQFLIDITNTVAHNPIKDGKLMRRKKAQYNNHGYGMKSIQYVVNKYNGYMTYHCEEDIFYHSILFNMSEK